MEEPVIPREHKPGARSLIFSGGRGLLPCLFILLLSGCFGSSGSVSNPTIGGTVTGLEGSGLVLQTGRGDELAIDSDGPFVFSRPQDYRTSYTVTVATQPGDPAQTCIVENASGEAGISDIENIEVRCTTNPLLEARPDMMQMHLEWARQDTVDILVSSDPDCDWANYALCENGRMLPEQAGGELTLSAVRDGFDPDTSWFFVARAGPAQSQPVAARPVPVRFTGAVKAGTLANGRLYVGGGFSHVEMGTGGLALVTADKGEPVGALPQVDGTVHAIAPDGEGGWYIGGAFDRVAGVSHRSLVRIRANGALDPDFVSRINDGTVHALQRVGETLYVGGAFETTSGQDNPSYLATFDAVSGELDQGRMPRVNAPVNVIVVDEEKLYIGGDFTEVDYTPRFRLAAFDRQTGALDRQWDATLDGSVNDMALKQGMLYVAGDFGEAGQEPRQHLAAFVTESGELNEMWRPPVINDQATALSVAGDRVYVGGEFTLAGGNGQPEFARPYLAAFDAASGEVDPDWAPEIADSGFYGNGTRVRGLSVIDDRVYVAGFFLHINDEPRSALAALDKETGALDPDWEPVKTKRAAQVVRPAVNGIYVGGSFTGVKPVTRNRLAAFDAGTGALDLDWAPGVSSGPGKNVRALLAYDGRIFVGGEFSWANGESRERLAAFDAATGTLDPDWSPSVGDSVQALLESHGRIIAGGGFSWANGERRGGLAAFDAATGILDPDWSSAVNGSAFALLESDGQIIAGGGFSSANGESRGGLAAFDAATGTLDPDWSPAVVRQVFALYESDGRIFAGGGFSRANGEPRENLAAFDRVTGALDETWDSGATYDVETLVADGGIVYVAGENLRTAGGQSNAGLAALDIETGAAVADWDPMARFNIFRPGGVVLGVLDGKVYAVIEGRLGIFDAPDVSTQP